MMSPSLKTFLLSISLAYVIPAKSKDFQTNALQVRGAPKWVRRTKIEKVTNRIQMKLEWSVRRVEMIWYPDATSFSEAHSLGPQALAVTQVRPNGEIFVHMGPRVTEDNYQEVVGHELVHVILRQKYKSSIPKWLEEGLANHLAKKKKVNYKWLARQDLPSDVKSLAHPMKGSPSEISLNYVASQAFAEMLDKKCDLQNLIRLSVERKMEDYIRRTCEITDFNAAFKAWVKRNA